MSKATRTAPSTQYSFGTIGVQMDIESPDSQLEEAADRALALLSATTQLGLVRLVQDNRHKWARGKSEHVIESEFTLNTERRYSFTHSFDLNIKIEQAALEHAITTRIQPVVQRMLGSYIGNGRYGIMPLPSLDTLAGEFADAVEDYVHNNAAEAVGGRSSH